MAFTGTRMVDRDVIALLYANAWHDADNLLQMVCTVDAESGFYPVAWHWNDPKDGGDGSTDWGLFQLNDGNKGGSAPKTDRTGKPIPVLKVRDFATAALDPAQAVVKARALYNERGFDPWFGHQKWQNYAPANTRALCNWLREKYGIPLL